ncbi:hypothetical protein NM540_002222 [Salmonella enterica]|nr:hypothetical protein [Salmonella enterica]EEA7260024.1 hypothetical protein [Salmonella enterica subsp. enterica serovar Glostrup]EAV1250299.1 hypothetical protein [Salmonella enterica]EAV3606776.1 hypothetical protein [Salmonella enterica]ECC2731118.1 hypothetical protein [Salmonella enterica]
MSRAAVVRKGQLLSIDTQALNSLRDLLGATQEQLEMAYSRALRRTGQTLRKRVMGVVRTELAPKSQEAVRRRLVFFRVMRRGRGMEGGKMWFGLNAFKVKDLKGKIKGEVLPRHSLRSPVTGRFVVGNTGGSAPPVFIPSGGGLSRKVWPGGFIMEDREEKKRIYVRNGRRAREATINVYGGLVPFIEEDIFPLAIEIFMKHLESELRGRVKMGIHGIRKRGRG